MQTSPQPPRDEAAGPSIDEQRRVMLQLLGVLVQGEPHTVHEYQRLVNSIMARMYRRRAWVRQVRLIEISTALRILKSQGRVSQIDTGGSFLWGPGKRSGS